MQDPIVKAQGLAKDFGKLTAVDGIDFDVGKGECFGFLGPNGAGKTTAVRMVHCFTPVTAGSLTVFGLDATRAQREIKARIGVCPQEDNLDPDFSVRKNLLVYARYFGLPAAEAKRRAAELLSFVQLADRRGAGMRELSGGMKRRLIIARALLNRPDLLILDEPTTGLDPQARHQIWERVRELKKAGTTILLTTHYMEEAAQLCDRLVILDKGRIVERGEPEALVQTIIGKEVIEIEEPPERLLRELSMRNVSFERSGSRLYIYTARGDVEGADFARRFQLHHMMIRRATLEDVFLRRTGRTLRE